MDDDTQKPPRPLHPQLGKRRIVTKALITAPDGIWAEELETSPEITYQHTVLCQASLPYTNPGELWEWERSQGAVSLKV